MKACGWERRTKFWTMAFIRIKSCFKKIGVTNLWLANHAPNGIKNVSYTFFWGFKWFACSHNIPPLTCWRISLANLSYPWMSCYAELPWYSFPEESYFRQRVGALVGALETRFRCYSRSSSLNLAPEGMKQRFLTANVRKWLGACRSPISCL